MGQLRTDSDHLGPGVPVVTVRDIMHVSQLVSPGQPQRPAIAAGTPGIVIGDVYGAYVRVSSFDGQGDKLVARADLRVTTSADAATRTAPEHRVNAVIELLL